MIITPTGKSFEVIRKCLVEPHRNFLPCFCLVFPIWFFLVINFAFSMLKRLFLKDYSCTVIHPNFPCKYVFIYLMIHHFLLVEFSHSFYIVSLIVWLFFLRVVCFRLQEIFEGWYHIEIHQIENCLPLFLESEDVDPHNKQYPIT